MTVTRNGPALANTAVTYTITVKNTGLDPTVGTVTAGGFASYQSWPGSEQLISGSGWSCLRAWLSCTRTDSLASGASYPPITLTCWLSYKAWGNMTVTAWAFADGIPRVSATDTTTIIELQRFTAIIPALDWRMLVLLALVLAVIGHQICECPPS